MSARVRVGSAIRAVAVVVTCGLAWPPAPALSAPRCADIVRAFLMSAPAELLSVKTHRDGCLVTYLMHRDGKRPMRVTRELRAKEAGLVQAEKKLGSFQVVDEAKVP
ncbi:hypothetical protein D3C80_711490 [compost metagenome]